MVVSWTVLLVMLPVGGVVGDVVAWRGLSRIPDAGFALLVGWGWCCWCGVVVAGGLFVENYTVDASIFVVKLSRANGGCLGTRSR